MMLSILILLAGLSLVASKMEVPAEQRQQWLDVANPYFSECVCETNVRPDYAIRLFTHLELPDDACFKCFLKCLDEDVGLMDPATGEIVQEAWVQKIEGMTPEIAANCSAQTANITDVCQKAYDFDWCFILTQATPI